MRLKVVSLGVWLGVEIAADVRSPNITGSVDVPVNYDYAGKVGIAGSISTMARANISLEVNLDKSSIYGRSSTVQPASVRVLPLIKT